MDGTGVIPFTRTGINVHLDIDGAVDSDAAGLSGPDAFAVREVMFVLKVGRLYLKTEVSGIFNVGFYAKFGDQIIRALIFKLDDVSAVAGIFTERRRSLALCFKELPNFASRIADNFKISIAAIGVLLKLLSFTAILIGALDFDFFSDVAGLRRCMETRVVLARFVVIGETLNGEFLTRSSNTFAFDRRAYP